jgi:putative molybdopterin biosynthesis protein
MGRGSGSVTTFSAADGFVKIPRHQEILEKGAGVDVQLLGRDLRLADLVVIGSHCVGLDYLLGCLQDEGLCVKFLAVGSTAGLEAAKRAECDLAGVHLLDAQTGQYNFPFLTAELDLLTGYQRRQGIIFRIDDVRFRGKELAEIIETVRHDPNCMMVNRNQGSGTRILLDQLLAGDQPNGYAVQAKSHTAVAAAVEQGRADWSVAIESVARSVKLGFLPVAEEHYDFVVPKSRRHRPAVQAFAKLLSDPGTQQVLRERGVLI